MESEAREKYESVTGNTTFVPGLCVKVDKPWLAATPDGVFLDENQNITLVEIKCPISCQNKKIDVKYIVNGELKKSDPYYTQCQIQMFCTNARTTHFFVYSAEDYKLIEVKFDHEFI